MPCSWKASCLVSCAYLDNKSLHHLKLIRKGKQASQIHEVHEKRQKNKEIKRFIGLFLVFVCFRGNHKVEDACEMYARAANMFKMAKNWSGGWRPHALSSNARSTLCHPHADTHIYFKAFFPTSLNLTVKGLLLPAVRDLNAYRIDEWDVYVCRDQRVLHTEQRCQ